MIENYIAGQKKRIDYNKSFAGFCARMVAYVGIAIGTVLGAGGCNEEVGGNEEFPTAVLSIPNPVGEKPHSGVIIDASASLPGSSQIIKMDVDYDGDGFHDYTETASNAPDGSFDLVTVVSYPEAGDYTPTVTITNAEWLEDIAAADVKVGFGDDSLGAYDHIQQTLEDNGYTCIQNVNFQVLNPSTFGMTAYSGLEAELSGEISYVVFDWASLTQEQRDTINARAAEGLEPQIMVIMRHESPQTIDTILEGM